MYSLHQNHIYTDLPSTSLEQFLRAIWGVVSQATVLIFSRTKLDPQLSHCTIFFKSTISRKPTFFSIVYGVSIKFWLAFLWLKLKLDFFFTLLSAHCIFFCSCIFLDLSSCFLLACSHIFLVDFQDSSQSRLFTLFICLVYFGQVFISSQFFIYCLVVLFLKLVVKLKDFNFIQTCSKWDLRDLQIRIC